MEKLSVDVPGKLKDILQDRADTAGVSLAEYVRHVLADDVDDFDLVQSRKDTIEEKNSRIQEARDGRVGGDGSVPGSF